MLKGERFGGSLWKTGAAPKIAKVKAQRETKNAEHANMRRARRRDGYCRFPGCPCETFRLVLEVAHAAQHRGMGGNPAGDRSDPSKLILMCVARHRANRISVDKGTLRIRPLNKRAGYGGPCAFDVDKRELLGLYAVARPLWMELGRETARHVWEPFTDVQRAMLARLEEMKL